MTLGSVADGTALVGASNDIDIRCGPVATDKISLQAYDEGVPAYEDMITLNSHATLPTMVLHATGGITANAAIVASDATGTGAASISTVEGEAITLASTDATTAGAGGAVNVTAGAAFTAGAGGAVDIDGGAGAAGLGGNVVITGGAGNGAFAGGTIDIDGGTGGAAGAGGPVTINGGAPASGAADGGDITVTGGAAGATSGTGGDVNVVGGASPTSGTGGDVNVTAGASTTAGAGGAVDIDGGAGAAGLGGAVELAGGAGDGAFAGGAITVVGGTGGAGGAGGAVDVTGGAPASGTAAGGDITITGGAAGATAGIGGDVTLVGGASATAGAGGAIDLDGGAGAADVGGAVEITGGAGDGANAGGAIDIDGGTGGAAGDGGAVTINGGVPASGIAAGGAVTITGGAAGAGGGTGGEVTLTAGAIGGGAVGGITLNGTVTLSDQAGTGGGIIDAVSGQTLSINLSDNVATALDIQESTNDYITVNTLNDFEEVEFGVPVDMERGRKVSTYFEIFDDFLYQTIAETDTPWILNSGTDTEAIDPAINAQENGVIRLTTGDASGVTAADTSQIVCHIPMQADNGGLVFETRLHINTAITDISVNAGFTDSTGLNEAFTIAAGTYTSVAADAAVFVYDTGSTTDDWHMCAVDGGTDDTGCASSGTAPVHDAYQVLRIEVSADGATIRYYIDGVLEGTLTGGAGVSPDVNLYASVAANSTTTTSKTVDIDYIWCGVTRG